MITPDLLTRAGISASTARAWAAPLAAACQANGIDSPRRLAAFLANVMHETGSLNRLAESMDYAAERLPDCFTYRDGQGRLIRRFSSADAQRWGRTKTHPADQRSIAERAYGGRMGNGLEGSGDGWLFRGHGALQTTGRTNHAALAKAIGWTRPLAELPAWLVTIEGACQSAAIFWRQARCNVPADAGGIAAVRWLVNGGSNGLAEVTAIYGRLRGLLGEPIGGGTAPVAPIASPPPAESDADRLNGAELGRVRSSG